MHPAAIAAVHPDRPAIMFGRDDSVTTFAELDAASNRLAQLLRRRGLEQGDTIALLAENHPRLLEVTWAAQRAGLAYTAVNTHLRPDEARYIVEDSGTGAVIATTACLAAARAIDTSPGAASHLRLLIDTGAGSGGGGRGLDGWEDYAGAVAAMSATAIDDEAEGGFMLYSSGTTGRPKGIRHPLPLTPLGEGPLGAVMLLQAIGVGDGDVFLCPAPHYHAAPLAWSMGAQRLGATVVVMERFDPEECLSLIQRHGVTHGLFVPTMFVRMLKLPAEVRERYDVSSLRQVVHAAAPCPVTVKRSMLEWWGPIISEFYSSTEGVGITFIGAEEWLAHPGSVGRPMLGEPHILDDQGRELSAGEPGTIWFGAIPGFAYHNDPDKTAGARNEAGHFTVGDIGYLDADGYLFLTDRKAFTIISGGVNIYPRESEDVLIAHPAVADVAVLGVPDPDMGEQVKAVVQPAEWPVRDPELEAELLAFCRDRLSAYKCPRSVDFVEELPRTDAGKLYKRELRARYWPS